MSFDPNLLHNNGHNGYPNGTSATLRETGVIEKLLTSYGFIQCSERQARLFFHCSQYNGNLQELKVGGNLTAVGVSLPNENKSLLFSIENHFILWHGQMRSVAINELK